MSFSSLYSVNWSLILSLLTSMAISVLDYDSCADLTYSFSSSDLSFSISSLSLSVSSLKIWSTFLDFWRMVEYSASSERIYCSLVLRAFLACFYFYLASARSLMRFSLFLRIFSD